MLFTLEMYSKTNMVNLNNKKPGNAWPGVVYSVPEMNSEKKKFSRRILLVITAEIYPK